jgi:hypothetical protein
MLTRPYIIQYNRIVVERVGAVVNYNLYIRWSGNGNGDAMLDDASAKSDDVVLQ